MSKVLVIIPAYNEEESLYKLINDLRELYTNVDYLVVDDCSSDKTATLLKDMGANYVSAPVNLGIGGAVQTGYKYAKKNEYNIAIQVDGDGQHDISFLGKLIEPIENDIADVVIGSRFIEREGFQSSSTRRAGIFFLSGLIRVTCGCRVRDVTSGFRAVNRRFINMYAEDYPDDYPEPEAIVTAKLNGARIVEVPVIMRERKNGKSSISAKKSIYYMIKVSLAIVMCRLSLGVRRE